jgi:hypothetical protein
MPNATTTWRKSTHSGGNENCVECAADGATGIAVRDSKNPHGPALHFPAPAFAAFTAALATHTLTPAH